ncbi:FAD-dependent oxidoreductase [Desemzia sp. RIT804]|uniref:FAD-dependent oxidoreductase n=1 Tax=Desemzia sp. RIT 804 TaxID=2810209 RepID=UPI00194F5776|nr:FAD-dependent oxidoreductase [Desemzia sp. RIT 804]MBM6616010.1 FAD-dependent oxidoreductase [Desemzia sp. RIT 804]
MKIIVIGSVAAGTSVAAKARRNTEEAEIVVYEQGKEISYSVCGIPYAIGGEVSSIEELTPRDTQWFKSRYNVDVKTEHSVVRIDKDNQTVQVRNLKTGEAFLDRYDTLVLATGASPITPHPFDKSTYSNVFQVRTIENTRHIKDYIQMNQVKSAVVIGAGFIGLEMTEQLTNLGINVSLVELANQVMPSMDADMAFRVEEHLAEHGAALYLGDTVASIQGEQRAEQLLTTKGHTLGADMVILATGVRPNTALAEEIGIELGKTKAIKVNTRMQTSVPTIYAVGDVVESFSLITGQPLYRPLGSTANKMGRIAGDVITGGTLEHRGILGTGIYRVFDLQIGQTGLTEKEASHYGYEVEVLYNIKPDHADYLGGKEMTIKALADKASKRVLGAQIVGQNGVDKRIDVLATAISFKAKAEDLFHLDLAYAPPFATTKDPVLYTGMGLDNALNSNPLMSPEALIKRQGKGDSLYIIDTRSKNDYEKSHVKGAVHIPLADLRKRANELDKTIPTVTYCNKGVTGNAAQNILLNLGFEAVFNLSGGNKNYQLYQQMLHSKKY